MQSKGTGDAPHTTGSGSKIGRRSFVVGAFGVVGASALLDASAARATPLQDLFSADEAKAPAALKSRDLIETAANQRRWMSLPASRLVVNPYDFNTSLSPLDYSNGPEVPLNLGYYVGNSTVNLGGIVGFRPRIRDKGSIDAAWEDSFDTLDPAWAIGAGVDASVAGGRLRLNLRAGASTWWGELTRWVEVDLDSSPYLQISVTALADAWGLQVRDATGARVVIQPDSNDTGSFTYNLKDLTKWSGTKRLQLVLRVAVWEKPAEFEFIRISGVTPVFGGTKDTSVSWMPHELPFTARYADGATLTGTSFFVDVDAVARSTQFTLPVGASPAWAIGGAYTGTPSWTPETRTLTVSTTEYAYAITFSIDPEGEVRFYATLPEMLSDTAPASTPPGGGYWSVPIRPEAGRRGSVSVAVAFATTSEGGVEKARQRARAALRGNLEYTAAQQERFWDSYLASVPRASNFAIQTVDARGVTPEQVRKSYYDAWVFLAGDVLPPLPEVNYHYPQLATGKPSMWGNGAPGAVASAQWESPLAMQFYAYVDPTTAWGALRGMLSQTDSSGAIGGEGLPARMGQTAAVLYGVSGDISALRGVYPALRRHLLWQEANPRWVFKNSTPKDQKDAQFVASVLIDMGYARDLAKVLGYPDDVMMWDNHRAKTFGDYLSWFWLTPTSVPIEWYVPSTGQRSLGDTLWISCGLNIDLWPEGSPQLQGLIRRFAAEYKSDGSFGGFSQPKYSDTGYTSYGLLAQARRLQDPRLAEWARGLTNSSLRDVVRANQFAESYFPWSDPPRGTGVRPSFFGVGMVLDGVMMNNGYRIDLGAPSFLHLTEGAAGLYGLRIRDRSLTAVRAAGSDTVKLSGSLIRNSPECRELTVPLGDTVGMSADCVAGPLVAANLEIGP